MTPSPPRSILRLGTRGSLLARTQSQQIAHLLAPHFPGKIELQIITTSGDQNQTESLAVAGGKGLFVKEIEEALLAGQIDFAVHSAKDLPAQLPPGLVIASTPTRELPNDMWIGHNALTIAQLPPGATVGTTSLRRQAQLLALRPDLKPITFRGNIDTRLRKVAEAENGVQGTFLAAAGLRRAQLVPDHALMLPTDQFVPAPGQGTLALQSRSNDPFVQTLLSQINHPPTAAAWSFERLISQAFTASCTAPVGICAEPRTSAQSGWIARALIATPDGRSIARATLLTQDPTPPGLMQLAPLLIQTLDARGARAILAKLGVS